MTHYHQGYTDQKMYKIPKIDHCQILWKLWSIYDVTHFTQAAILFLAHIKIIKGARAASDQILFRTCQSTRINTKPFSTSGSEFSPKISLKSFKLHLCITLCSNTHTLYYRRNITSVSCTHHNKCWRDEPPADEPEHRRFTS